MQKAFSFTLNGQLRTVTTEPRRSLLEVLREDLGLTGTKYGCGEGQCRACTVLMDDRAKASCTTSIEEVQGRRVVTIESLAEGEVVSPLQQAFLEAGSFQCGYCTPGMIMGIAGLLKENPRATEQEILAGLERHLCRCCNYPGIASAVRRVVTQFAQK